MDGEVDMYTRNVYTIMGVLKDVGGFYNSLFFAGLLLYSRFQGTIVFSSLVSKLYQIEQVEVDETASPTKERFARKSESTHRQVKKKIKEIKEELLVNMHQPDRATIQRIKDYLSNRWRIQITFMDNFKFIYDKVTHILCRWCKSRKDLRYLANVQERKVELYKRGESKIKNELDCISILTKLRYLDVLLSIFLSSD